MKLKNYILGAALALATVSCSGPPPLAHPDAGSVYNISHKKASKGFHEFAINGNYEEAWMIFDDNKVIDICNTTELQTWNGSLDDIVDKINESNAKEITFAHTHPIKAAEKVTQYPTDIFSPTTTDYAIFGKVQTHENYKGGKKLKGEVYDGQGVWKFHFTEELEKECNERAKEGWSPIGGPLYKDMVDLLTTKLGSKIDKPRNEKINDYIEAIKKHGVILEYIPKD